MILLTFIGMDFGLVIQIKLTKQFGANILNVEMILFEKDNYITKPQALIFIVYLLLCVQSVGRLKEFTIEVTKIVPINNFNHISSTLFHFEHNHNKARLRSGAVKHRWSITKTCSFFERVASFA